MIGEKLLIKYRTWYKGLPPRPIKLPIPGWGGNKGHSTGDDPQPWHCIPFIEGSTYGLELLYPFEEQCIVRTENSKVIFENNFQNGKDVWFDKTSNDKGPFSNFAPGHYGYTSAIDIMPPPGFLTRIETHPKFFTDSTGTVPIAVPGHLRRWWSRIFFVVFKAPSEGAYHIFRKNEPFAQLLFVPENIKYDIQTMSVGEIAQRKKREEDMLKYQKLIYDNSWKDKQGHEFNDKYKKLNTIYLKEGVEGVDRYLKSFEKKKIFKFIKTHETFKNKKKAF